MTNKSIFIAAFAGVLFGYGTCVTSGAILYIGNEFGLSTGLAGLVVASVLMGAFLGSLLSGASTVDYKILLSFGALFFILGSFVGALSPTVDWLIMGRFTTGAGIGILSYAAPVYISEISSPEKRGALVSLNQLAICSGMLLSYCMNYLFSKSGSWGWMIGFGIVPALLFLLGVLSLPSIPKQNYDSLNWSTLFSKPIRPALIAGLGIALIQQITGINTILYYAPSIFKMAGLPTSSSMIGTITIGLLFFLFSIVAILLIDRFGRRRLLFIGLFGMTLHLSLLSWAFKNPQLSWSNWLAIYSMAFYLISFAISLGPITWLLIAEIFPSSVRTLGAGIATAMNWGSNFIVTSTFLTMIDWIDASGTFCLYAIISALSLLFVFFFIPETKGVPLEQVQSRFFRL